MAERVDELAQQLRDEDGAIMWRLVNLLGPSSDMLLLDQSVHSRAEMWAAQLRSDDDNLAAQTVRDLVDLLWPHAEPTPQWWGTPLGQVVARSVGHPDADVISYSVAAAMLGCSRQNITNWWPRADCTTAPTAESPPARSATNYAACTAAPAERGALR